MSAPARVRDLLGVGIGPFNLGLAALLDQAAEVDALFLEDLRLRSAMTVLGLIVECEMLRSLHCGAKARLRSR